MRRHRLERVQFFPRPPEEVFAFFCDIDQLDRFTPSWFRLHVRTAERCALYPGQQIDYTLKLFGIPFGWTTVIDTVDPPRSFSDSQLRGPYRSFRHHHLFCEVEGGTLMVDVLDYQLPLEPAGLIVHRLLAHIFDHRRLVTARLLAPDLEDPLWLPFSP